MIGAIAIGLAAGIVAGLLGVGGGVLFVPGLVLFVGLSQHHAEATSLLAIVPVAIVGTYRQDRYGNVRRGDALLLGLLSVAGAAGGVALANALSGAFLRDAFAALILVVAAQLTRRALAAPDHGHLGGDVPRHGHLGGDAPGDGHLRMEDPMTKHHEVE
jgi:uncharacterized membrane protein YfcA